jgi:ADP-ribose pyrophosphatase YjhB (NUDIX family)
MKQLNQVLVCAFNSKGHVLTIDSNNLPHGCMLPDETQRETAVRIMREQTGCVITEQDLVALMYDVIKGEAERHILCYLCTKVLTNPNDAYTEQPETHWYNSRTSQLKFLSTQQFLLGCSDYDYNHAALLDASTVSTQMRLPWSKTCSLCYTSLDKTTNPELKETEMQTTTEEIISKMVQTRRLAQVAEYNRGFKDGHHSELRITLKEAMSKFYTETEVQQMLTEAYQDGLTTGDSLSTSEIQSLVTQQSKVIFELECEISELKELTSYLSERSYIQEVQDLRKAMFNRMSTKQKRLGKLVSLQTKLKRSK